MVVKSDRVASTIRCLGGLCCTGRFCHHCGQEICRPANVMQTGLSNALVCDDCWLDGALSWQQGYINMKDLAGILGVSPTTVQNKLSRLGLRPPAPNRTKEGIHKQNAAYYWRHLEQEQARYRERGSNKRVVRE